MNFDYKTYSMRAFLICSEKYKDRKESSLKVLENVGIKDVNLIDAVFVDKVPADYHQRFHAGKIKRFGLGMIGCYLAWENLLKTVVNTKGHIIAFEDDIYLTENFEKHFDEIHKVLCEESPVMIQLHNNNFLPGFSINRSPKRFVNTQALLINRNFKRQLSDWYSSYYGPSDQVFQCISEHYAFKKYHIDCDIARQCSSGSIIKVENKKPFTL